MKGIDKSIVNQIDEELMSFIVEDTRMLVSKMNELVSNDNTQVFSEFDRVWEVAQNVIELYFIYFYSSKRIPKCDEEATLLTFDLLELHKLIYNEYGFDVRDECEGPQIIQELMGFMKSVDKGKTFKRKHYFTIADIEYYKSRLNSEN